MTASLNVNHYAINNSQQEKYFGKKLKVVSSLNHIFPLLSNDKEIKWFFMSVTLV